MKTKLTLVVALMCLLGASVSAAPVDVAVSADTYIQYNKIDQGGTVVVGAVDVNYGGAVDFITEDRANYYRKAFLQFDVSSYNLKVTDILSISVYYTGVNPKILGPWFLSPAGGIDNNWTESGITWVNAPYNDGGAYTGRAFNNNGAAGELVYDLTSGGRAGWTINTGWNTFTFNNLTEAEKAAMLAGLQADGKITIGLSEDDGKTAAMHSKEAANGLAAYMTVDAVSYATNFSPADGALVFTTDNPQLQWEQDAEVAGTGVTYDVWFGTDPEAMDPLCEEVTGDGPFSCNPGPLAFSEVYYWQVIAFEPNYVAPFDPNVYEGPVLSFETGPDVVVITGDPVGQTVAAGTTNVQFSVTAVNAASYQWYQDGSILTGGANYSGQTTATLTINTVQLDDEGTYHCVASNAIPSSAPSNGARLMTKRLVGQWQLQGDLTDSVGTYDGAPVVGTAAFVTDSGFQALDLTAATNSDPNRMITMAGSADFYTFHPQGYSVSVWVKAPAATLRAGIVGNFEVIEGTGNPGFGIVHNASGNVIHRLGGAWGNDSSRQIADNVWHQVTVTYDGSTGTGLTYVDGVQRSTVTSPNVPFLSAANMMLGAEGILNGIPQNVFNGYLADVRIHSYPLTIEEILNYYHGIVGGSTCVNRPEYDFTGDCRVNLEDFALLASQWLDCNRYPTSACDL